MARSITVVSVAFTALLLAQSAAAAKDCTIMGEQKEVSDDAACPGSIYDTVASLRFEKEVERDGKKMKEVDTFSTFLALADAAGMSAWLKGTEKPPKVHGDPIPEIAVTVFVPTDKSLEGMKADLMADEKVLRKFVGQHILPMPLTRTMYINKFPDTRATILFPETKRLDVYWLHDPRIWNGLGNPTSNITSMDHIAANGVVHVLDRPVGM